MPHFYMNQYVQRGKGWRPPAQGEFTGWDMRTLDQQSQVGGVPEGYGLFQYADPKVNHELSLGNDIEANLTLVQKSGIETLVGKRVVSNKLLDVLKELWTVHTDPTGITGWKPLVMNNRRQMEIIIHGMGAVVVDRVRPSHPTWQKTIEVFQADYRLQRALVSREADLVQLRKQTGYQMRKMGIRNSDDILPTEHKADSWLPPETSFTESWPTDSTDITTGMDQAWTEVSGNLETSGGNIQEVGNNGYGTARCDTALSGVDHYAQQVLAGAMNSAGDEHISCCRYASGAYTMYNGSVDDNADGTDQATEIYKFVASSFTSLGVVGGLTITIGDVWKFEANGSTLTHYEDTVSRHSLTDSSITAGNQVGVAMNQEGEGSSFAAADLAASSSVAVLRRRYEGY